MWKCGNYGLRKWVLIAINYLSLQQMLFLFSHFHISTFSHLLSSQSIEGCDIRRHHPGRFGGPDSEWAIFKNLTIFG